jgi:mannose-6-phosphate isomerase
VPKPWGSLDLQPWNQRAPDGVAIGEIWFQRTTGNAPDPALLLKLLFARTPLSIQVHPDDDFARGIGLPHGKTEAWYILAAAADAKVAVGPRRRLTRRQLRTSIENGTIADLVDWRQVRTGDVVFIPAGTIHAIGAGLVIAEVQQSSDATFRLFDYGSQRELQIDNAMAVANAGPAAARTAPRRLTDVRTLLVACPWFVLERFDLAPGSRWDLNAADETWLLVLGGQARLGPLCLTAGDAAFLDADRATVHACANGLSCLVAYLGSEPDQGLLRARGEQTAGSSVHFVEARP